MRILEMDFSTELGRTKTIRVYEAKTGLTNAEVIACMDNIIAKNIFTSAGGDLTGKADAQIITTTTEELSLI